MKTEISNLNLFQFLDFDSVVRNFAKTGEGEPVCGQDLSRRFDHYWREKEISFKVNLLIEGIDRRGIGGRHEKAIVVPVSEPAMKGHYLFVLPVKYFE